LERGVSASAKAASADGIERISFQFLYRGNALPKFLSVVFNDPLPLHDTRYSGATSGALGANGRMPAFLAGRNLVFRNKERNKSIGLFVASSAGDACRNGRNDFEKIAAVHWLERLLHSRRSRFDEHQ